MRQRSTEILESLDKFRVLSRDQIIQIHFQDVNQKVVNCNRVLNRLRVKGLVRCDTSRRPYDYYTTNSPIKIGSSKVNHFKSLADFYIDALNHGKVTELQVEPKLGKKGTVEPDIFMVWNDLPLYVEVQRHHYYTLNQFDEKISRYRKFHRDGGDIPGLLIIDKKDRDIEVRFPVYQARDMEDLVRRYKKKNPLPAPVKMVQTGGIQVQIK